jgi:hypothetical protein
MKTIRTTPMLRASAIGATFFCLASPHAFRWRRNRAGRNESSLFLKPRRQPRGDLRRWRTRPLRDHRRCAKPRRGSGSLSLPFGGGNEYTGASLRCRHDGHWAAPLGARDIIFQQPGGNYSVNVTCYNTGNSAAYSPVVY